MKTHYHASDAERAGAVLGRASRKLCHQERRLTTWFTSRGWSARAVTFLVRAVELVALGALLYTAFWLALLLLFALIAAWTVSSSDCQDDDTAEWRNGVMGFGLYVRDGSRIDPHDVEDEE